jgi:hypothetical protein
MMLLNSFATAASLPDELFAPACAMPMACALFVERGASYGSFHIPGPGAKRTD